MLLWKSPLAHVAGVWRPRAIGVLVSLLKAEDVERLAGVVIMALKNYCRWSLRPAMLRRWPARPDEAEAPEQVEERSKKREGREWFSNWCPVLNSRISARPRRLNQSDGPYVFCGHAYVIWYLIYPVKDILTDLYPCCNYTFYIMMLKFNSNLYHLFTDDDSFF